MSEFYRSRQYAIMPICSSADIKAEVKGDGSQGAALGLSLSADGSQDWTAELRVSTPRVNVILATFAVRLGSEPANSSWQATLTLRPEGDPSPVITTHDLSRLSGFTIKGRTGSTAVRPIFVDFSKFL